MRVDEVLADFDGFMSSADHVEFYWVPHTGWALTKRNRRTDEPAAPRGRAKEVIDDLILPERRLRGPLPDRPAPAELDPADGQDPSVHGSPRVHGPQRPGLHQPSAGALLRDGVRHPAGCGARGAEPGAGAGGRVGHPAQLPGRGAGGGARTTSRCPPPTAGRPATSPCTCTRARPTTPTSRASSGSWTPTAVDPTGGRCTSRATRPSPTATRVGTTSRPSVAGSIRTVGSRTRTSSVSSVRVT